ncbi:hypothetical protein [Streptomyces virginiae]|uniref:hypothetical protein n=1 Tax=Streptomyces virginiae TaxID=1961 RepID=UPI003250F27F
MREVADALPGHEDPTDVDIALACAEADPEPFLETALERRLGTGALLRALRVAHRNAPDPWRARRATGRVLKEPYRLDWALIAAADSAAACRARPRTYWPGVPTARPRWRSSSTAGSRPARGAGCRHRRPSRRPDSRGGLRRRPGYPSGGHPATPDRSGRVPSRRAAPCGP